MRFQAFLEDRGEGFRREPGFLREPIPLSAFQHLLPSAELQHPGSRAVPLQGIEQIPAIDPGGFIASDSDATAVAGDVGSSLLQRDHRPRKEHGVTGLPVGILALGEHQGADQLPGGAALPGEERREGLLQGNVAGLPSDTCQIFVKCATSGFRDVAGAARLLNVRG